MFHAVHFNFQSTYTLSCRQIFIIREFGRDCNSWFTYCSKGRRCHKILEDYWVQSWGGSLRKANLKRWLIFLNILLSHIHQILEDYSRLRPANIVIFTSFISIWQRFLFLFCGWGLEWQLLLHDANDLNNLTDTQILIYFYVSFIQYIWLRSYHNEPFVCVTRTRFIVIWPQWKQLLDLALLIFEVGIIINDVMHLQHVLFTNVNYQHQYCGISGKEACFFEVPTFFHIKCRSKIATGSEKIPRLEQNHLPQNKRMSGHGSYWALG